MYIAMTERVFRTSLLMYINTDMYKESIEQNEAIWRDYERDIKKDFELEKYWRDGSCPVFNPSQRGAFGSSVSSSSGILAAPRRIPERSISVFGLSVGWDLDTSSSIPQVSTYC